MRLLRAASAARLLWRSHPPYWSEGVSGLISVVWAVHVLVMRGDLVDRVAYVPLARVASDGTWCAFGLFGGLLQLWAWCQRHRARWPMAVAMGCFWLLLADGVSRGSPGTPTAVPYLAPVLLNAISVAWLAPGFWRRR